MSKKRKRISNVESININRTKIIKVNSPKLSYLNKKFNLNIPIDNVSTADEIHDNGSQPTFKSSPKHKNQQTPKSNDIKTKPQKTSLQSKMMARLEGGRFRFLNELLYTTDGKTAFEMFQEDPELFEAYHEGYRSQVSKWPENPLDNFINYIKKKPVEWIIGDFGCGDARLSRSVKQKVYSFDLVSKNENVIACDIANVPLSPKSLDIAVFCLSLMGTNFMDYLKEAHRVLKDKGILLIAEVKSRFENINSFVKALHKLGFDLISKNDKNVMFITFEFVKTNRKSEIVQINLKSCKYKKR